jgi:hypothetical protein
MRDLDEDLIKVSEEPVRVGELGDIQEAVGE